MRYMEAVITVKKLLILFIFLLFLLNNLHNLYHFNENQLKRILTRYRVGQTVQWNEHACYYYDYYDYMMSYRADLFTCNYTEDLIYYQIYGINNTISGIYVSFEKPVLLGNLVEAFGRYERRSNFVWMWNGFFVFPTNRKSHYSLFTEVKSVYIYDYF